MKVLLTGATGLIGREIGKLLVTAGHSVVALSRDAVRAERELPFPAEVFSWAGGDTPVPVKALQGIDGVIHLAGESVGQRWTSRRKAEIRASRVAGTRRLVDRLLALESAGPRVFVSGSAIGYYGDRGDEELREDAPNGEGFLASVTADWEAEADRLTTQAHGHARVRVVKVRTGIVLSPRGGALEKMVLPFAAGVGSPVGSGRQWMSWIHLEDIARLFVFALEDPSLAGAVNGTAPGSLTNRDFSACLAGVLRTRLIPAVPALAVRLATGEMGDLVLHGQRAVPAKALAAGFSFRHTDLAASLRELLAPMIAGERELFAEQWVPRKPEEVFPFFADEKNLEEITPPHLGFRVRDTSTPTVGAGTLINYDLSLHGIPFGWQTRIDDWEPGRRFVDTQLKGPYRKWHHTHEFIPLGGGTLLRDRVRYVLPLGGLGKLVAGRKVAGDVSAIFAYRRKVIHQKFGRVPEL